MKARSPLKDRLHEIIFEADTREGRIFDIVLLAFILASVVVVMLETMSHFNETWHTVFVVLEWIFTIFFTIEYALRLYSVSTPIKYAKSFYGIIDLLAILPTYLSVFVAGSQSLIVIRALRLLRVFRIFKMISFLRQGRIIVVALRAAQPKIMVFLMFILIVVCIFGSIMYLVEGGINEEFDSIPRSIYWAIVTMTTVGYGDIAPQTGAGQFLAAVIMIMGYAVIAVPTGIVSNEFIRNYSDSKSNTNTQACRNCARDDHDDNAVYCKHCGEQLNP